ncbi:MAG: TspO/MBR family protein [Candidatus Paceibacterota bacterium]
MDYQTYYQSITKPFFAPPDWVFGVAWGIIYPLMALALVYLLYLVLKRRVSGNLLLLYAVNILANLAFTPIQLVLGNQFLATVDILVVLGTLSALLYKIYPQSKIVVVLLAPYFFWGAFATILQITLLVIN